MTGQSHESNERQAALRRKVEGTSGPEARTQEHPLLTLQSQIGNAQVARLLQRAGAPEEDEIQTKHDLSLQRAGAPEEDEIQSKHDLSLQRAGAPEEDEIQTNHDLSLQREADMERVGIEGGPVGPDTAQRIESARGGGSSLDASTRSQMEAGFGTSFEDVRVHHDSQSDMLNRRLTAHAFTTGSDIFLRGDASPGDNHLIAHELTHVVQQRSMSGGGGMSVGAASDSHENDADATADAVLSNAGSATPVAAGGAQREAAPEDELQTMHDLSQREAEDDETPS